MLKKALSFICILMLATVLLAGCKKTPSTEDLGMQLAGPKEGDTIAVFVTDQGTFKAVLFGDLAPLAVENFVALVEQGYYDGIIFHRVVPDFVIQSGDPTGTGSGGMSASGTYFANEYSDLLHHYTGALGMANAGTDQNASQFYIVNGPVVSDNLISQMETKGYSETVIQAYKTVGGLPTLDYRYTVFGQVYEGLDVVAAINGVKTDDSDRPVNDVKLVTVYIEIYTAAA